MSAIGKLITLTSNNGDIVLNSTQLVVVTESGSNANVSYFLDDSVVKISFVQEGGDAISLSSGSLIKLTAVNGDYIWVNPNYIYNVVDNTSYSSVSLNYGGAKYFNVDVTDTVAEINVLIDDIIASQVSSVFDGLTANGTTSSTTSICEYGVNVFSTVTLTNYATKLPQPTTGRTCSIVNLSSLQLYVFPSNVGGQINNLAIDAPAIIPPDGKLYTFVCIENPLPGAWTFNAPATSQIQSVEFSVAHTNGVATNKFGVTQAGLTNSNSVGVSGGNITLVSTWLSENIPTSVSTVKCYTNIVLADYTVAIQASLITGYKTAINGTTFGQRNTFDFDTNSDIYVFDSPVGTLSSPPNIGDTNTLYGIYTFPDPLSADKQIGTGGAFSRYYYQFGMFIPASAATKTYKFQFFLETF